MNKIEYKVLTQYDYDCLIKAGMSKKLHPIKKETTSIGTMYTFLVSSTIADKADNSKV